MVHNKGALAVLHNRNKMVNTFTNTEWVSGSGGAIISRSVTSCAGMTAFLVLLAQTRVGFLSGGRGKNYYQLPAQEQASQKEEAYARATVALTREQQICFIMGPLDMQGLVGAATIIGCLRYGASFSGLMNRRTLSSSSVSRMTTYWSRLMTRPSCKACGIHVQELMEFIRPLRW